MDSGVPSGRFPFSRIPVGIVLNSIASVHVVFGVSFVILAACSGRGGFASYFVPQFTAYLSALLVWAVYKNDRRPVFLYAFVNGCVAAVELILLSFTTLALLFDGATMWGSADVISLIYPGITRDVSSAGPCFIAVQLPIFLVRCIFQALAIRAVDLLEDVQPLIRTDEETDNQTLATVNNFLVSSG